MKVIFLDVDGVLNNMSWAVDMQKEGIYVFRDNLLYEPAILMLQDLVEETGAVIVLSSSWRKIPSARADLVKILEKHQLRIHSDTPYTAGIRGDDIKAWFADHKHCSIESYVIIDDDADMLEEQLPYLVQTTFEDGLQDSHYRRAKAILNCTQLDPSNLFWRLISHRLPSLETFYSTDYFLSGSQYTFFQNGDQILSRNEEKLNALADFFNDIGLDVVTSYYDPDLDEQNGTP